MVLFPSLNSFLSQTQDRCMGTFLLVSETDRSASISQVCSSIVLDTLASLVSVNYGRILKLLPVPHPGNSLWAVTWHKHIAHLIHLSLQGHSNALPIFQCLKITFFFHEVCSILLLLYDGRGNPVPVTPSQLETAVSTGSFGWEWQALTFILTWQDCWVKSWL